MQQILSPVPYVSLEKEAKLYLIFPACCALFIALTDYSVSHQRSSTQFFSVSPRHLRNWPRSKQIVVEEM